MARGLRVTSQITGRDVLLGQRVALQRYACELALQRLWHCNSALLPDTISGRQLDALRDAPPVIGEACTPEQQIFELEILLYKSSRKKLAVKQVPVIGEAYTPEQQILELEI
jgi:hypothetical protein